jgi:hypothetical protein
MVDMNTFDKLWFDEVKTLLDKNYYNYKANASVFYASRKYTPSIRYIIKINRENIEVTIPFKEDQEFTTKFTEYFKVSEFLIYHIKSDLEKYGKPKIALSEAMFH